MAIGDEVPPFELLKPLSAYTEVLGVSKTTIFRWATRGVKPGPIMLRAWLLGVWKTTDDEVRSFIQQRTNAKINESNRPGPPTQNDLSKRAKAAMAALKAEGFRFNRDPA